MSEKPTVNLDQILECTICLDVSSSPIHNCVNGHIICGICIEKVRKCGQCGGQDLTVSNLAERLSRQFEMEGECDNKMGGCVDPIRYSDMKNHIKICEYRNIKCNGYTPACVDQVSIKLFWKHLKEVHTCQEVNNGQSGFFILNNEHEDLTQRLITFDNHEFIWHLVRRNQMVYWWVTVLGGSKEASNYHYESRVVPLKPQLSHAVACIWELPVLPFHENQNFSCSKEGLYTNITFSSLSQFFLVGNGSVPGNFGLEIEMKIISLEKEPDFNLEVSSVEFKAVASASADNQQQRRSNNNTVQGRAFIKSRRQLARS